MSYLGRSHLRLISMDGGTAHIGSACSICKKEHTLHAPALDLQAWYEGKLIQTALPSLTDNERELLMTGYDQECWDKLFPPEEDEDERVYEGED